MMTLTTHLKKESKKKETEWKFKYGKAAAMKFM